MFIEEVYRISWGDKETLEYRSQTYPVTPLIHKQCKLITKIHSLLIGMGVILALALASILNSRSFLADMLMVVIVLFFLSILVNYLARFIILKGIRNHG